MPTKIQINNSSGKGLGMFCTKPILSGEIIEECHVLKVPFKDSKGREVLPNYRFKWPMKNPVEFVIPVGYGCCYNHSKENNAYWREHPKHKAFQFYAVKDIEPGEEILIYYGNDEYWVRQHKNIKQQEPNFVK